MHLQGHPGAIRALLIVVAAALACSAAPAPTNAPPRARRLPALAGPAVAPLLGKPVESTDAALAWDAVERTYRANPGERLATFRFAFTNVTAAPVTITGSHASCGCTVAKLPPTPFVVGPGQHSTMEVVTDLSGKSGTVAKTVTVDTSAGKRVLHVTAVIPEAPGGEEGRKRNAAAAAANRQAVFAGDCATCHVAPAVGKTGQDLYIAACGICHDAEHRATMVPDLRSPRGPRDAAYWENWISHGRTNSLMPAFAAAEGGPLTKAQIRSLVDYLAANLPGTDK